MSTTTDTTEVSASVADAAATGGPRRVPGGLARFRELSLVPAILVLGLIGFIVSPAFLTSDNLIGVAQQSTELSLLVLAEALILIAGRMDLSLESTIGVAPVIAVWLVLPATGGRFTGLELLPVWTAIPVCLLVGAVIGAVNGFLILKLRLNGFIVTLGALTMLRGLQIAVSEGRSIVELPGSFTYLGHASWAGVPAAIWICALLFAVGGCALGLAAARPGAVRDRRQPRGRAHRRHPGRPDHLGGAHRGWRARGLRGSALQRTLRFDLRRPGQRLDLPGLRGDRHRRGQPQRRARHALRRADRCPHPAARRQRDDPGRRAPAVEPVPQRGHHHRRPGHLPLRLGRETGVRRPGQGRAARRDRPEPSPGAPAMAHRRRWTSRRGRERHDRRGAPADSAERGLGGAPSGMM